MIYDITMFFSENENDILDLKIQEELPYLDKLVVIESPVTFVGNSKPICFPDKYKNNDKIIHLVVPREKIDRYTISWEKEHFQRDYAFQVLDFNDDDIIMSTDTDEIVTGERIRHIVYETKRRGLIRMGMRQFNYYMNVLDANTWLLQPFAWIGKHYKQFKGSLHFHRNGTHQAGFVLSNVGNHFMYLGGYEALLYKMQNYSHREAATTEKLIGLKERMEKFEDALGRKDPYARPIIIDIDGLYPKTIRDNPSYWSKYMYKINE